MDPRLLKACMSGDEIALRDLIKDDPPILDRAVTCEETPLHVAAMRGHLSIVKLLLGEKAKLASETDASGCVPLHLAAAEGSVEIVRKLLRVNVTLCSARDHSGRIPLHLGVIKGRLDVVRELIKACPGSVEERLDRGETVFHLCIKYYRLDALKLLVERLKNGRGQLLAAKDDEGNTVLHFAAVFKQIETVKYLVSLEGVEEIANTPNGNGHTALDVLEKSPRDFNSFEILETLTQVGGVRQRPKTTNSARTHTGRISRFRNWCNSVLDYFTLKHQTDWIADTHGNLMVVATVVASMSFQAGINPPGGVWQEDIAYNNTTCTEILCKAGTAVLNYESEYFQKFYRHNSWALMAAICVILLHFGGLPLKNRVGTWLITLFMCFMLNHIMMAYVRATNMVVSYDNQTDTIWHIGFAWTGLLLLIAVTHTIRICYWLIFKKLGPCLRPGRTNYCCPKWVRVLVSSLVGAFVVVILLRILIWATIEH